MHLWSRLGAVVVSLGVMATLTGTPASAADTVGSPSVGDPNFPLDGNGGYDVGHYDLRLSYDPPTDQLWGTTTILATATQDLTQFNLDFLLAPSAVLVNNAPAEFTSQADGELVVRPAKLVAQGSRLLIVVKYRDTPGKYTRYGKQMWRPDGKGILIAGEPHIATWWFPSNDHPSDKATYDVSMAVPPGLEFISGGLFLRTQDLPAGWTRWNYRSTTVRTTYLASSVIGDFDVYHQTSPDGQQFITAYEKGAVNRSAAEAAFERTPELTDFLASKFGPYPFEANGGVLTVRAGGLETQGRPFVGDVYFSGGGTGVITVLHELAHQWFGNSVSVRQWRDAWLNEGFSTYAEYLWSEENEEASGADLAQARYDQFASDNGIWSVPLSEAPPYGLPHPAGSAMYYRGAMALQNLRVTVGDDTFLAILRGWTEARKYGNASTEDFVAHAEQIAGRSLDGVFDTWVYSVGKPATGPNVVVGPAT